MCTHLACVAEDIVQDLRDPASISHDHLIWKIDLLLEGQSLGVHQSLEVSCRVFADQLQGEGQRHQVELAGFDFAKVEYIIDDSQEGTRRSQDGVDELLSLGRELLDVQEQLTEPYDSVERRADLTVKGTGTRNCQPGILRRPLYLPSTHLVTDDCQELTLHATSLFSGLTCCLCLGHFVNTLLKLLLNGQPLSDVKRKTCDADDVLILVFRLR